MRTIYWILGSILIGLIAGIIVQATFDPFIKPIIPWIQAAGILEVEVRYQDGKLVPCNELSELILYEYKERDVFRRVISEVSIHQWEDLPPGEYAIEAYINDMYAGQVGWDNPIIIARGSRQKVIITPAPQAKLQVTVYQRDGKTPLPGAYVEIRSHTGKSWRSGNTDSKGATTWFYLQATTGEQEYYRADVYYRDKLVGSSPNITLQSGEPMEISITTQIEWGE
ncbi:MAG: hypothetical protein ACE5LX_04595 [Nitrospinota bacterium]